MFKTAEYYDLIYRTKNYTKEAAFLSPFLKDGTILDIGGGTGRMAQELKKLPRKFEIKVIDIDFDMLTEAVKKGFDSFYHNIEEGVVFPLAHNALLWFHVFNFFKNQAAAIGNLSRSVKKGGRIILNVWNNEVKKNGWSFKFDWRLTRLTRKRWVGDQVTIDMWYPLLFARERHVLRCPDYKKIILALATAGFHHIKTVFSDERSEVTIVAEKI